MNFNIPDLGIIDGSSGFRNLPSTTDGRFTSGEDGVKHIVCTGDGKVEFVAFENQTLAYVNSALGYGAYYPLHPVNRNGKIKAVLMDLGWNIGKKRGVLDLDNRKNNRQYA